MSAAADIAVAPLPAGRLSAGQALLWTAAGAAVLAVHAGALLWLLRQPPIQAASAAAPPAIMLELAPVPTAPPAELQEIAPDLQDAQQVESDSLPPDPTLEDVAPPPDVVPEQVAEPTPDLLPPVEAPPVLAEVVQPRPVKRPAQLKPREAEKVAETPTPAQPRQEQKKALAQTATEAPKIAAPQTSSGTVGSASPAKWQSRLMAHLERRKRYPSGARSRREEGVAYVRFRIDEQGNVLSAQLARSSGHPALDDEVVALLQRASPVPAPPPGAPREITAPVQFKVR